MNNISWSDELSGTPSRKFEEIHWRASVYGDPRVKDVYLVTVHVDGIGDTVMSADWNGERWSNEAIGEVTAYAHYPKGYIK